MMRKEIKKERWQVWTRAGQFDHCKWPDPAVGWSNSACCVHSNNLRRYRKDNVERACVSSLPLGLQDTEKGYDWLNVTNLIGPKPILVPTSAQVALLSPIHPPLGHVNQKMWLKPQHITKSNHQGRSSSHLQSVSEALAGVRYLSSPTWRMRLLKRLARMKNWGMELRFRHAWASR